jgi:hydrogenase expression/formation protein HypD
MKYVDAYRDPDRARRTIDAIARTVTRPWTVMEICGGQTHAILSHGIDHVLPEGVQLVHGPGCPVCVTPAGLIDGAIDLAQRDGVTLASFGDMARVPGSATNLLAAKARGADVRLVYSPLDALAIARREPTREVVFFAVGFETTAPATAMAVYRARQEAIPNVSVLMAHVLVPPAMDAILGAPDNRVQGFLAAGHVCTVTGTDAYAPLAARYGVPIVVTGFEPLDILQGLLLCLRRLEAGEPGVDTPYDRAVRPEGNETARDLMRRVFRVVPRQWRGVGELPASGLGLAPDYAAFDAERRLGLTSDAAPETGECISGQVLRGVARPTECPAFGTRCTPEHPLGAPMVSSEGACAAYYQHRARHPAI